MNYLMPKERDLKDLLLFWNKNVKIENLYKQMDEAELKSKFLTSHETYDVISFIAMDKTEIIGVVSGVSLKSETSFLTCILVSKVNRRQGIGSHLLQLLELEFKKNITTRKIDISFFNPVHLEWYIPNTNGCDHPNTPGVDMGSDLYKFLKHRGYHDFAIQNAYYKDLQTFVYREDIETNRKKLMNQGIHITLYNHDKHFGFNELFDDLRSEHWRKEIMQNLDNENQNNEILIVEKNDRIYGFAGPLSIERSGRGKFAGIGVHSSLRGLGAGKVLFASLCMEFKIIGAQFMSLFTGDKNPARKIYEAEDFKIIRTWVNMRKDI